jgi:uncharacterized protein (DUF58 family)
VSPTPRLAVALAVVAVLTAVLGTAFGVLAVLLLAGAAVADLLAIRAAPRARRTVPAILARGVRAPLTIAVELDGPGTVRVRQPVPPDLGLEPREAEGGLDATLVPLRRGRHTLGAVALRREGPLGLARTHHRAGEAQEVLVYPDLPAARRLALAVRSGRFREQGRLTRGPLGLGTDFESIRDYAPDDDIRQVNWRATQRLQRPMSNQFRVEQDREVMLLVDGGRLMSAPLGDRTRLDAAIDAAVAVALVADVVGDRAGTVAFDRVLRRRLSPRRAGGDAVVRALFDLEPRAEEPDYEQAFRTVEGAKRSLILIFTDLLEEAAARPLVDAVPVLARRHAVIVASATDPDLDALVRAQPRAPRDVYAGGVALEVLAARARVAHQLQATGARVVEAPAGALGAACVRAYLTAKAAARL